MTTSTARRVTGALCTLVLVVFGAPWAATPVIQAQQQLLYISATGIGGSPVTDLALEEVVVQWDGEDAEITDVELIEWPVRLTVMVDNGKGGRDSIDEIRAGLKALIAGLADGVEMSPVATSDGVLTLADYTTDKAALTAAVDEMERGNDDAAFLDAMIQAADGIAADTNRSYFPVFLNLATDGPEGSEGDQAAFEAMVNNLVTNAGTMHTRLLYTEDGDADQSLQAQVAGIGQQTPGGSYVALSDAAELEASMRELAADISRKHGLVSAQYRVTYTPPSGSGPAPGISVGSTRAGLNLVPTIDGNLP